MTSLAPSARHTIRVLSLVGTAHFMSHLYFRALPPLFVLLVIDLNTSYTALGLIMTVYHIATATVTTPMGFVVDRLGARRVLVIGLLIQAIAMIAAGFYNSYWSLMILFAVSGLAFAVYHPSNYAIMSGSIHPSHMGRAFSVHALSGNLGNAFTPVFVLAVAEVWNWQAAFFLIGSVGLIVAMLVMNQGDYLHGENEAAKSDTKDASGPGDGPGPKKTIRQDLAALFTGPVLLCFLFYVASNLSIGGIQVYGVAALVELYDVQKTTAGGALTGFMIGAAGGILIGGFLADKFGAGVLIPVVGLIGAAAMMFLIGTVSMPVVFIVACLAMSGFLRGGVQATRDLIVLSITPKGATGKVFAFVYNGAMIGGAMVPLIYGWFMDNGKPEWVFLISGGFILMALLTFSGVASLAPGGFRTRERPERG